MRPPTAFAGAAFLCRTFLAAALVLSFSTISFAQGEFRVQLSPNLMKAKLKPGSRNVLEFSLANADRENDVRVSAFYKDIQQGARGQYLLSDTATQYSIRDWIEIPDTLFLLPAGQEINYQVKVTVPPTARGGGYGAIVFEILPGRPPRVSEKSKMSASYRFQMPSFVEISVDRYGGVLKRVRSGEILVKTPEEHEKLKKRYPNKFLIATEIENTGNLMLEVKGRLIIRDVNGRLIKQVPLGAGRGAILPGATTYLRSYVNRLNPGRYTLRSIVQYGGHSPAVSVTDYEVTRESASQVGELDVSIPLAVEIMPNNIDLKAPVSAFRPFGATIVNREQFPIEVIARAGQIYHDVNGELWSTTTADSGRAIVDWMEFEPKEFTINANRRQNVRVTVKVPEGATGGNYGCLLFSAKPVDTASDAESFLPAELRLPIQITVPPDFELSGEVTKVRAETSPTGGVGIQALFRNTGNMHVKISGQVTIQMWAEEKSIIDSMIILSDPRFEDVGRVKIESDSVLIFPGESRMLTSETMEQLPAGKYRARLEVNYGAKQPALMDTEFVVKPE
jgi:hypothetical protein